MIVGRYQMSVVIEYTELSNQSEDKMNAAHKMNAATSTATYIPIQDKTHTNN